MKVVPIHHFSKPLFEQTVQTYGEPQFLTVVCLIKLVIKQTSIYWNHREIAKCEQHLETMEWKFIFSNAQKLSKLYCKCVSHVHSCIAFLCPTTQQGKKSTFKTGVFFSGLPQAYLGEGKVSGFISLVFQPSASCILNFQSG